MGIIIDAHPFHILEHTIKPCQMAPFSAWLTDRYIILQKMNAMRIVESLDPARSMDHVQEAAEFSYERIERRRFRRLLIGQCMPLDRDLMKMLIICA